MPEPLESERLQDQLERSQRLYAPKVAFGTVAGAALGYFGAKADQIYQFTKYLTNRAYELAKERNAPEQEIDRFVEVAYEELLHRPGKLKDIMKRETPIILASAAAGGLSTAALLSYKQRGERHYLDKIQAEEQRALHPKPLTEKQNWVDKAISENDLTGQKSK